MQTEEEKAAAAAAEAEAEAKLESGLVLSQDAQNAFQAKTDLEAELRKEIACQKMRADEQTKKRKALEAHLKAGESDKDKELDELAQQNELLIAQIAERDRLMGEVASQQIALAVTAAVAGCTSLIDSEQARADFAKIISPQVGMVDGDVDGKVVVLTAAKTSRTSVKRPYQTMTLAELADLEIAERDYMRKPLSSGGGTGAASQQGAGQHVQYSKAQMESMTPEELSQAVSKMTPEQLRAIT